MTNTLHRRDFIRGLIVAGLASGAVLPVGLREALAPEAPNDIETLRKNYAIKCSTFYRGYQAIVFECAPQTIFVVGCPINGPMR